MTTTLTIRDETTLERLEREFTLTFEGDRLTVKQLIRERVKNEVQQYNAKKTSHFHGLVQPTDAEKTLNGYKLRQPRLIDWEKQYENALKAFQSNGFLILVDDRQVDDLEEFIEIRPDTIVTFLKLVPLVGG